MTEIVFVLLLMVAVAGLATLAAVWRVPYPILLVIGGAVLGFAPELPQVHVDPEVIFTVFVPPLVYAAAVFTSWRDFVTNFRPIASLGIGLVIVSTIVISAVTHYVVGLDWAPAFVFGAVVSNTDTTAVAAIAQQVGLPRRVMTILEGESLINDAIALTAFRMAVVATVTGVFSPWTGLVDLALDLVGATIIGLAVGWLTTKARAHLNDPHIAIIIGLLTPYAAYLPAEQLGASGILAVVIAGLYIGRRESRLESATTRLQSRASWDVLLFILNGLLFILVGVQLSAIWADLQDYSLAEIFAAGAVVSLTVIALRVIWVALTALIARWTAPPESRVEKRIAWRDQSIISWAGLRGGDTLAAALSVPLVIDSGAPFPARAEIVFLAFVVIIVTLVGQGLTLPVLVRLVSPGEDAELDEEETLARRTATRAALDRLDELARDPAIPPDLIQLYRDRYQRQLEVLDGSRDPATSSGGASEELVQRAVLQSQREALLALRDQKIISDEVMREVERDLDLEEARFLA